MLSSKRMVFTAWEVVQFITSVGDQPIGFDIETSSLDPTKGIVAGFSLAVLEPTERAIYVPLAHAEGPNSDLTFKDIVDLLEDEKVIPFNGLFEGRWIWVKCQRHFVFHGDAAILSRMLQLLDFGLKDLTHKLTGRTPQRLKSFFADGEDFDFTRLDQTNQNVIDYATDDSINGLLVEQELKSHKTIQKSLNVYELELAVQPILARAEAEGVTIDLARVLREIPKYRSALDGLEDSIFNQMQLPLGHFKLNSTKRLGETLFGTMGIVPNHRFKTKTGFSCAVDSLESNREQHPVIE